MTELRAYREKKAGGTRTGTRGELAGERTGHQCVCLWDVFGLGPTLGRDPLNAGASTEGARRVEMVRMLRGCCRPATGNLIGVSIFGHPQAPIGKDGRVDDIGYGGACP